MAVSIVKAHDSYQGTLHALNLIRDEIREKLAGRSRILIKPNFVSASSYLSATPVGTVEAVLDFLHEMFNISEILIGESPAIGDLDSAIKNYGYDRLRDRYPELQFIDLDSYDQEEISLRDEEGKEFKIYLSRLVLDDQVIKISPCRAKTHNVVVVTLSIKNLVMGAIKRGYKSEMHKGYYSINYNIAKLAVKMMPDLGVIDGVEGMEGEGPVRGAPKKWGVVFASTNPVSLDAAAAYAMGFKPSDIGYLYFLTSWEYGEIDPKRIKIIGVNLDDIRTAFRPHSSYQSQLSWKRRLQITRNNASSGKPR